MDVQLYELSEQRRWVLRRRGRAAITDTDIEHAVGPEGELAAEVVVRVMDRFDDVEELLARRESHPPTTRAITVDIQVEVTADVIDEEPTSLRILRIKGH